MPYWFKIEQFKGADKVEVVSTQEIIETTETTKTITNQEQTQVKDERKEQRDELLKSLRIKIDKE